MLSSPAGRRGLEDVSLRCSGNREQQPAGRVGRSADIAETALFLCSEKAGFITGENICVDGGMTKLMIYNDDHGWEYRP